MAGFAPPWIRHCNRGPSCTSYPSSNLFVLALLFHPIIFVTLQVGSHFSSEAIKLFPVCRVRSLFCCASPFFPRVLINTSDIHWPSVSCKLFRLYCSLLF